MLARSAVAQACQADRGALALGGAGTVVAAAAVPADASADGARVSPIEAAAVTSAPESSALPATRQTFILFFLSWLLLPGVGWSGLHSYAGFAGYAGPGIAEHRAGGEGGVLPVRGELRAGGHALSARLALQDVVDPEVGVGAGRRACVGGGLPIGDLGTGTLDVLTDRAVAGGRARRHARQ